MKIERVKCETMEPNIGDIVRYKGNFCLIVEQRYPSVNGYIYGLLNIETNEVENNFGSLKSLSENVTLIQKSENITIKF